MCTATRWRVHVNTRDMPVHLIVGHYWSVDTLARVRVLLSAVLRRSRPQLSHSYFADSPVLMRTDSDTGAC
jgi:hypothetical protein